jgi:hypothetical protein
MLACARVKPFGDAGVDGKANQPFTPIEYGAAYWPDSVLCVSSVSVAGRQAASSEHPLCRASRASRWRAVARSRRERNVGRGLCCDVSNGRVSAHGDRRSPRRRDFHTARGQDDDLDDAARDDLHVLRAQA